MNKIILLLVILCITTQLRAQPEIVFQGEPLDSYVQQEVVFDQTLYVCGRYYNNLYLSYERLRSPNETAIAGSDEYVADSIRCAGGILTAYLPEVWSDTVRLGATLSRLTATVTDSRKIRISGSPQFDNNERPTAAPSMGEARITVCAANLQYYCPEWEGTFGAGSDQEFAIQRTKLMKALQNINADLYAFAELQQGSVALESIVSGLNALTAPDRYAYVADEDTKTSTYTKVGYIYRTDKIVPVLKLGHSSPSYSFSRRQYVQAFQEISTNERFVLSMNHFLAKDNTGSASTNAARMDNAEDLISYLDAQISENYYEDSDILIVGDLNCATMEEPIIYLDRHGYENMLSLFAPNEYSYVYDNLTQYIDHVFASPSLVNQITNAAPYHLNADETNRFSYSYGDTTMYRYSDHDPIIIGLRLSSGDNSGVQDNKPEEVRIWGSNDKISICSTSASPITIYDIIGRIIYSRNDCRQADFPVQKGLYFVRLGEHVYKVGVY